MYNVKKYAQYAYTSCIPFIMLGMFFLLTLFIWWPGHMAPDSIYQFQQAKTGIFCDSNPPIMAFVWRILLYVLPGSSGILLMHLILLFGSVLLCMCATQKVSRLLYVIYPLLPPIFLYAGMIWKDVSFAYAYLFCFAIIMYYTLRQKQPGVLIATLFFTVLFYGMAVKFQGKFIALPILIGFVSLVIRSKWYGIFSALISYAVLIGLITLFNNTIVKQDGISNHWKFVKIYDLAGISILKNKPLFPAYIMKYPLFSFEAIQQKFNYERVDDIVFFAGSPIPREETYQDRKDLLDMWQHVVIRHPLAYIQHRFHNWWRILCAKPLEKMDQLDKHGISSLTKLQNNKLLFLSIKFIRYVLSFFWLLLLLITACIFGIIHRERNQGKLLLIASSTALLLILTLFPCTMASSLRYVYLAVCFAYIMLPLLINRDA